LLLMSNWSILVATAGEMSEFLTNYRSVTEQPLPRAS
jgi:hypothetical protein